MCNVSFDGLLQNDLSCDEELGDITHSSGTFQYSFHL